MAFSQVKRIPVPDWAPEHAQGAVECSDGFTEQDYQLILSHRDAILSFLHTTVEEYLREMTYEDDFPSRDRMTGDYYLGRERYSYASRPLVGPDNYSSNISPIFRMNFDVRCLERPWTPHVPRVDDYLGLDVDIRCNPVEWRLCLYATDSSVI